MKYIFNNTNDPYFNMAAEEYLLKETKDDIFMLWVNSDVIVIGRNQNTMAEINYDYVTANGIPVVRRLTGGGAVFHDKGNLNFTFIQSENNKKDNIDFAYFGGIIIGALKLLGINAELSGRNDLTIDGKKFSGNAATVYQGRILHHGTLMLNIVVDKLTAALNVDSSKIEGKGIKSVRSRVTNINEHLEKPITINQLVYVISKYIEEKYWGIEPYAFTEEDINAISALSESKYRTWEWNYGETPAYNFRKSVKYPAGRIEVNFAVKYGIIRDAKIYGDFFGEKEISEFEQLLSGKKHRMETLQDLLRGISIEKYFYGISKEELLNTLI